MKKVRTIRIDKGVSDNLDSICTRHGDVSWHIENALNAYFPVEAGDSVPDVKPKGISPVPIKGGWVEGDRLFELFWLAGMKKTNKKKAKPLFLAIIKKAGPTYEEATTTMLIGDIKKRLTSNQLGFDQMHPTTYLNGERWNDEVIPNAENQRSNQPRKSSVVDRAHAAAGQRERDRQARAGNGSFVGEASGSVRPSIEQPVRGNDTRELGTVVDGSYTRTD